MAYVALHNHSYYSLLDSAMTVEDVVAAAAEHGMAAVGLTDRDTLAGAVQFYKQARAAGLHPVIGCEVTLETGTSGVQYAEAGELADSAPVTAVLLVENAEGYRNLCRLLTTRIEHPRGVTFEDLAKHSGGLICLLGPESEAAACVRRNQPPEPGILRYREVFGRNLALEICPHNEEDLRLSRVFAALGRRLRIPLVTTADAHYRSREDRLRYDVLASIGTLTMLRQPHPAKHGAGNYHLHSPEEMERHFGGLPQALRNTGLIAARCRFDFELGDILFPPFPVPDGETPMAMLRRLAGEGAVRRYGARPSGEVFARLERELSVIEEVGYAEYFLIFWDIVRWANSQGIETLARGSAAGSLVCYTLGISNVCPFRFGLCFERFLNRERMQFAKLADIDLDLPWDRRDGVVEYVIERYGQEHVAMIGAFNTFQGRAAVADIAKVYGIPEREARRFTERLPYFMGDAETVVRTMPECRHLPYQEEPYRAILKMAGQFQGFPRHASMHPCGLVISRAPVADRMPLFRSAKGLLTTQYAMDEVEELGLLKMDLLGQAGLSVLRDARENVRANRGLEIDLRAIDWSDGPAWEAVATGNARGVFHIESPAITGLLMMADCRDMDCLTAVESIIRPGAANEGKKRAYARRRQGLEPVTYAHPSLEPLLADTYGLMAYEEHILLVANGFAGMPWGHADMLRRALVKNKDRRKIEELGREFRECARRAGRTEAETEAVWELLEDFAGYMFNKAHSAAYAVEAFQGVYMKTRYPVEFLAAVLSNRRGFYAPIVYVLEALRCGARFLAPDVNLSEPRFLVRGGTIRLPLDQVKGMTQAALERLYEARKTAPFADAGDFFRRVRPQHDEWLALLKTGALDSLGEPRGRVFWRLCRLEAAKTGTGFAPGPVELEFPRNADSPRFPAGPGRPETGTAPVFPGTLTHPDGGTAVAAAGAEDAPGTASQARWEHELLGFPVSCHPLAYFGPHVDWGRYIPAAELPRHFDEEVEVCGLIVAERIHPTDRGPMKFLTLADYTGFAEVSLFAETYRRFGHLTTRPIVAVRAKVEPFDNRKGFQLTALRVREA